MLLIFSCLVCHLFVSPSCMYTPWEQAPGWFCAWLWPQGPAQGPPHPKCCQVWNLILPRLQANELAFDSCMGAGRRHETRRLEIKDFILPKIASSVCSPGFPCSWFSRGRQDLGRMVRACTMSLCSGRRTQSLGDFMTLTVSSVHACPSSEGRHYLIPQGFLLMTQSWEMGKEQSGLVCLAHPARCVGAWVTWRNVVNICWMNEWKKPSLVTRCQRWCLQMDSPGVRSCLDPRPSLALGFPSTTVLLSPHHASFRLHSLRLNACWDLWHLLLPPESDTIFFCLLDGDSPQCLWLAVAPESALPHPHITLLFSGPTLALSPWHEAC